MGADAVEDGLALAGLAAQLLECPFDARQGGIRIVAQQGNHAAQEQPGGIVDIEQQRRCLVQASAQDQVFAERDAQRDRGIALGRVAFGGGADRGRQPGFALRMLDQHRQHAVAQRGIDAVQQGRIEGAGADLDQRVQVGGFMAAQAGRQQRRDAGTGFAGQQRHAQQGQSLAVAAQHGRALPVAAQRRDLFVGAAQGVEAAILQRQCERGPDGGRRNRETAPDDVVDETGLAQARQLGRPLFGRQRQAGRHQVFEDALAAHRLADQGQQGQDRLFARVEFGNTHAGRFSISTAGRPAGTGMLKTRR